MDIPEIVDNTLDRLPTSSLLEIRAVVELQRDQAETKEDDSAWDVCLGAVEVELWSRGYGPNDLRLEDL